MSRRSRLYFSFRSPFSWLLVERLRRTLPDAFERIDLSPYWEPDEQTEAALAQRGAAIHYAAMSKAKHLYILQDVKRLAADLELTMSWPVDTQPWWEPAHLTWLAARRAGQASEFYDAIVAARWGLGEDISRLDVVRRAAAQAGLEPGVVDAALADGVTREEGVDCLNAAYEDDIFGVPYMRQGWRRYWGYDRLDAFLAASGLLAGRVPAAGELPLEGVPSPVQAAVGSYDRDTAGGCG